MKLYRLSPHTGYSPDGLGRKKAPTGAGALRLLLGLRWSGGLICRRIYSVTNPRVAQTTKLRRLGAYIERGQPARLLAGALGAVERAVATAGYTSLSPP
jgi:hypothetical protein